MNFIIFVYKENKIKKLSVLNYADFEGILPIHYAVLFGNIQTIKFLVGRGVEVNQQLEGIPILHLSLSFAGKFFFN